jgi:hypothetical protein
MCGARRDIQDYLVKMKKMKTEFLAFGYRFKILLTTPNDNNDEQSIF